MADDPATASNEEEAPAPGGEAATATPASVELPKKALVLGVPARAVQRLAAVLDGWEFVDDPAAGPFGLAVLSSRVEAPQARATLAAIQDDNNCPVVALTHPGGENASVDLVARGATIAVPEGREGQVAALHADATLGAAFVETYRTWSGTSGGEGPGQELDQHAGIPGPLAFDDALSDLAQSQGETPRVLVIGARHFDTALRNLALGVAQILRRRLAQHITNALRPWDAQVFSLDQHRFAALFRGDEDAVAAMVAGLRGAVESYAPVHGRHLRLGVGHAGIEDSPDPQTLRDLAERACDVAMETGRRVISASELVDAVADRTDLQTLLLAVSMVERRHELLAGHSARVTDLCVALGRQIGIEGTELDRLEVAARFHDVGKISLPDAVLIGPEGLEGAALDAYRSHVEHGAKLLTPGAGTLIATSVRHHHERWDGTGFPQQLEGETIPVHARVIAVASAFDRAVTRDTDGGLESGLAVIRDGAGTLFDPTVVTALQDLAGHRQIPMRTRA